MIQAAPFTFVPKSGVTPTLEEYKAFHGMICGISSSRRCIDSFDGCAIFAPLSNYEDGRDLASFDYNRTWPRFHLFSYYALVVLSYTGLLSLLGRTRLLVCREEMREILLGKEPQAAVVAAESFDAKLLYVPSRVVDYMLDRSRTLSNNHDAETPKLMLQKRFEFQFGNYASVVMFHFVCNNGFRYLVEVFETHTWYGTAMLKFVDAAKSRLCTTPKRKHQ
jgi:hypothetical protein